MRTSIKGVITASITPFTEDGQLYEQALAEHVDFLVNGGVDGLFVCGTYGQGPLMSIEQRVKAIGIVVEANGGRVPVIAHIGATSTEDTVRLCKHATDTGADAVAATPPWYYSHDERALVAHYKAVASATSLPVFVYNNPARTGISITPENLAELAEIENLLGIKDSGENLPQFCRSMRHVKKQDFLHVFGSDDQSLAGLLMGAVGIIVVLTNIFPMFHVGLYRAFLNRDYGKARELQQQAIAIRDVLRKGPYISIVHEVINMLGRKGGFAKSPLRQPTDDEKRIVREGLRSFGLI